MFSFCATAPFLLRHAAPAPKPDRSRIELAIPPRADGSAALALPASPIPPVAIAAAPGILMRLPPTVPAPTVATGASREPWLLYARPFDRSDPRPRIALVIGGPEETIEAAIETMPGGVTLALDPYARRLPEWIALARTHGHEIVLALSPAPGAKRRFGAGPATIISSLDAKENGERLGWVLERAAGYVGVLDFSGEANLETISLVPMLKEHGLMLVDASGSAAPRASGLPHAVGDLFIDGGPQRETVEQRLAALETLARNRGSALAVSLATPSALRKFAAWTASLDRKAIALAPVTAIADSSGAAP